LLGPRNCKATCVCIKLAAALMNEDAPYQAASTQRLSAPEMWPRIDANLPSGATHLIQQGGNGYKSCYTSYSRQIRPSPVFCRMLNRELIFLQSTESGYVLLPGQIQAVRFIDTTGKIRMDMVVSGQVCCSSPLQISPTDFRPNSERTAVTVPW
jgi:hypothetical protein